MSVNALPREYSALNSAARAVREASATQQAKDAVELFKLLEESYLNELRTVAPEGLQRLQGKLAQLAELRRLFAGDANTTGIA